MVLKKSNFFLTSIPIVSMNSLVSSSLNFRLCNLPHLGISQPYFQFRWIGFSIGQNPLVSTLFASSTTLSSSFLRGSKGRYSSSFLQNFLKIFFFFFFASTSLFQPLFSPCFPKRMQMYNTRSLYSKFFGEFFWKFFFEPFLRLKINFFRLSPYRLAFKADAKVIPAFILCKLYPRKKSKKRK